MENFLEENFDGPKKTPSGRGYRRVFFFVLAIALLWQVVSFVQLQISMYHHSLAKDFKVLLPVTEPLENDALNAMGAAISSLPQVRSVKLFSPQDGLKVLQAKNPQLAEALVVLGREPVPTYFELRLTNGAISAIEAFTQQLVTQYPQLSVKYSQQQADMVLHSGLCLRTLNIAAALILVLFLIFMFMVEAYPTQEKKYNAGNMFAGLLAGLVACGLVVLLVYPTGLLAVSLQHFTTWERQICLLVFCGLLGWTLGKWKKF
ncbi:MAG: hypothetical protein J6U96_03300 [Elusimicrobiaceae bacterium]|nr:hypothetical protein [Elusimicrobiaceae bacterium]